MRGQILGYDFRTGLGEISGDNGQRYKFVGAEWRPEAQPRAGQSVDFEARGDEACAIYGIAPPSVLGGVPGQPNKLVAGLLALFIGTLGIHKFYLGYNRAGLIMLLVSVFGAILLFIPTIIMGLIAFIEAITYLTTPDDQWYQRYVVSERPWF